MNYEPTETFMSSPEPTALTIPERDTLGQLEERIRDGLQTFIVVGDALMAIRDSRLYRADFPTFEDYCSSRWGITRGRAYQLIEAAGVVAELAHTTGMRELDQAQHPAHTSGRQTESPLPETERQARPLAQLDTPEDKAEAWAGAVSAAPLEHGKPKVRAADVQKAVEHVKAKRRTPVADKSPGETSDPAHTTGNRDVEQAEPWAAFGDKLDEILAGLRSAGRQLHALLEVKDDRIGCQWGADYSLAGTTRMLNTLVRNLEAGRPAVADPSSAQGFIPQRSVRDRDRFAKSA